MTIYESIPVETEAVGKQVVDAVYKVHRALGPGLLESVYEACLLHELRSRSLEIEAQAPCPIVYESLILDGALRIDLVVERRVIVELKAVEELLPIHRAQLLTYLRLTRMRLGFLINFNVIRVREGIERVVL